MQTMFRRVVFRLESSLFLLYNPGTNRWTLLMLIQGPGSISICWASLNWFSAYWKLVFLSDLRCHCQPGTTIVHIRCFISLLVLVRVRRVSIRRLGLRVRYVRCRQTIYCYAERGVPGDHQSTLVFVHGFSAGKDSWLGTIQVSSQTSPAL